MKARRIHDWILLADLVWAAAALAGADWSRYSTYLQSRPDEAELTAIRLMLSLCREYRFRLHIVHLSTSLALDRKSTRLNSSHH